MKLILTAKLKLKTTPEQHTALRQVQLAYRDGLNFVSRYAFANRKMSNALRLQKGTYHDLRKRFNLSPQMASHVAREVGGTYQALWTKLKRNAEHRKLKRTKKRFKGLDQAPRYVSPTVTYTYGRDYKFQAEQRVSIRTLQGHVIVPYEGYHRHLALIQQGSVIKAAKLWYDKPHRQFYLLVSLELEIPDPQPEMHDNILGVDVGQRYLAVTGAMTNKCQFFSGKKVQAKANHYARLRKRLQRKGTRSATRRKIAMSGRERRFKLNVNHGVAKTIIARSPHTLIGLEELTGIRERKPRYKRRRKGDKLVPLSSKARRANRHASQWAFAELQAAITYKAALAGSLAIKVDADYTSMACPMCGYTDGKNRPKKGLLFICQNPQCPYRMRTGRQYMLHADLVGARNIAMRTLRTRQDWVRTGQLSVAPDMSDKEAKAERLKGYSELRWSRT